MIDFRYHLVSIVAIFLALALGIVLGSTTLSQSVTKGLRDEARSAAKRNTELRNTQTELNNRIKGEDQFSGVLGAQMVAERLKGQSVVFVETPGASNDSIEQLIKLVEAPGAGATVTGRVTVQKKFLDDNQESTVDELASQLKPGDLTLPSGSAYARAGAVLASAVVTKDAAKIGREDASGDAILNGFKQAGYVTTSGKPGGHATLAVVIAPSTAYSYEGSDTDNKALISLATAFDDASRGTVLGGPVDAADEGGLIRALRDSDDEKKVSGIDTMDTPSGQVVTILALQNELSQKSGQYGLGSGVNGYLPSPPPPAGKNG
ncbi:copper transporter [Spirillospora sp. CA-294931]|uniref:copper transporter n=1 Tax=Spirillospora sp. CA-294931 TaxID=3240042 RepID=UPI003D8D74F5